MHPNTLLLPLLIATLAAAAATEARYANRRTPPAASPDGVTYSVTNRANPKSPGASIFAHHIGTAFTQQEMSSATHFILNLFNQTCPTDRKPIKKITLFVDCMKPGRRGSTPVDAYSSGKNNEIHVNADFLGTYKGNIRREFVGIVYHHVARLWQWDGQGEAPNGLVSGLAEYVRMEAHYGTSQKVRPGEGSRWDQGDGVTARFLEYCEKRKKGFVRDLNRKMRYGYTKAYFVDCLGKPVDQLWKEYKASYYKKHY